MQKKPIIIKRAYQTPLAEDGYRVLVDRLWPRGLKKEALALQEWNKQVAPSTVLRKWFGHDPTRFELFSQRYQEELAQHQAELKRLNGLRYQQTLCLVYAAKDEVHNHAQVLKQVLEQLG